jgi:hypothetical protein
LGFFGFFEVFGVFIHFFWVGFLLPTLLKVFLRKLKKASEKKNWETVERLKANKPKYSLGKSRTSRFVLRLVPILGPFSLLRGIGGEFGSACVPRYRNR